MNILVESVNPGVGPSGPDRFYRAVEEFCQNHFDLILQGRAVFLFLPAGETGAVISHLQAHPPRKYHVALLSKLDGNTRIYHAGGHVELAETDDLPEVEGEPNAIN